MTNQCRRCGKPTEAWGQVTEVSCMSCLRERLVQRDRLEREAREWRERHPLPKQRRQRKRPAGETGQVIPFPCRGGPAIATTTNGSTTATVETLTAEVRVLMVGNRQITLSVAKQLDEVPIAEIEVFGRVCLWGLRAQRYPTHRAPP